MSKSDLLWHSPIALFLHKPSLHSFKLNLYFKGFFSMRIFATILEVGFAGKDFFRMDGQIVE
jgi:hypothetical protein